MGEFDKVRATSDAGPNGIYVKNLCRVLREVIQCKEETEKEEFKTWITTLQDIVTLMNDQVWFTELVKVYIMVIVKTKDFGALFAFANFFEFSIKVALNQSQNAELQY
jgi:hypothetical protein